MLRELKTKKNPTTEAASDLKEVSVNFILWSVFISPV